MSNDRHRFLLPRASALVAAMFLLGPTGCAGNGSPATTNLQVLLDTGTVPGSVDHLHFALLDGAGTRTDLPGEYPVLPAQTLGGVPTGTAALVVDFHTDDEEHLSQDSRTVSLGDGPGQVQVSYIRAYLFERRVAVVDVHANGNLLVRGNQPLALDGGGGACADLPDAYGNLCFAYRSTAGHPGVDGYEGIETTLKARLGDPAFDLDDYEIVQVVLQTMSNATELTYYMEFMGNGGQEIPWPIPGGGWPSAYDPDALARWTWAPPTYPAARNLRNPASMTWRPVYACGQVPCDAAQASLGMNQIDFVRTSAALRTLLEGNPSPASGKAKRLVYFHCTQGTDRTGVVHAAYILDRNPAMTFLEALRRATLGMREGVQDEGLGQFQGSRDDMRPSCPYVGLLNAYCADQKARNPELYRDVTDRCVSQVPAEFRAKVGAACR